MVFYTKRNAMLSGLLMQEPPNCMFVSLRPAAADNLLHFAWLMSISSRVGDVGSSWGLSPSLVRSEDLC